jgi:hypothetical protein
MMKKEGRYKAKNRKEYCCCHACTSMQVSYGKQPMRLIGMDWQLAQSAVLSASLWTSLKQMCVRRAAGLKGALGHAAGFPKLYAAASA